MRNLLVAGVLLALPVVLGAQPTPAQCTAAAAALAAGNRYAEGWERIPQCGVQGGVAIANALSTAKTVTDSIYLRYLLGAASRIRDGNVWQAAITLSGDKTATHESRVIGLLALLAQHDVAAGLRINLSWNQLMTLPWETCRFRPDPGAFYFSDNSLPGGAVNTAAAHFDTVADDVTNHPVIRTVAGCARAMLLSEVPETVDPSLIQLSYVCGTKFRVNDLGSKWVDVTYQVQSTEESAVLVVGPQAEKVFWTDETGTVVLFYLGNAIRTTANGGTAC